MPASRENVDDKIKRIFGELLDERERKSKEAADPKARFDNLMGRLENFLNSVEDEGDTGHKRRSRRRADDEDDEGEGGPDIIKSLFG